MQERLQEGVESEPSRMSEVWVGGDMAGSTSSKGRNTSGSVWLERRCLDEAG